MHITLLFIDAEIIPQAQSAVVVYCGTELARKALTEEEISAEQAGLESLGAELRNLCDRMTAAYADASVRLRRSSAASADREKELQAQLAAAQRELEAARAANIELKDKLQKMTSAYQTLKGRVDTAGAERNIPALCPRCGRKAEVGAVFCGNCGMRLVP